MFLSNSSFTKPVNSFKEAFDVLADLQENEYLIETYFNDSRFSNAIFDFNYSPYQSYLNESYTAPLLEDLLTEEGENFPIAKGSPADRIAKGGWFGNNKENKILPKPTSPAPSTNNKGSQQASSNSNANSANKADTKNKAPDRSNSNPETAKELKDKGKFLWHNVKAFAKNVWEKIKELCKLIFRKVKEWTANHLDLYNSKDTEITRGEYELLTRLPRILEKALAIATKSFAISEGALDRTKDQITEVSKEITSVSADAAKKQGNIKVGKNWLKTMSNVVQQLTTKLDKGNDLLEKQLTEVERAAAKAKSHDVSKDAQTLVAHYNTLATLFRTIASKVVEISNALMKSIEVTESNNAAAEENADNNKQQDGQQQQPQDNNNPNNTDAASNNGQAQTNATNNPSNTQPTDQNNGGQQQQQQPATNQTQTTNGSTNGTPTDGQTNQQNQNPVVDKKKEEYKRDINALIHTVGTELLKKDYNQEKVFNDLNDFNNKHPENPYTFLDKEADKDILEKFTVMMNNYKAKKEGEEGESIELTGSEEELDAQSTVLQMVQAMRAGMSLDTIKRMTKDIPKLTSIMGKMKESKATKKVLEMWSTVSKFLQDGKNPFTKKNAQQQPQNTDNAPTNTDQKTSTPTNTTPTDQTASTPTNANNTSGTGQTQTDAQQQQPQDNATPKPEEKIVGTTNEQTVKRVIVSQFETLNKGGDSSYGKHATSHGLYSKVVYDKVIKDMREQNKPEDKHILDKLESLESAHNPEHPLDIIKDNNDTTNKDGENKDSNNKETVDTKKAVEEATEKAKNSLKNYTDKSSKDVIRAAIDASPEKGHFIVTQKKDKDGDYTSVKLSKNGMSALSNIHNQIKRKSNGRNKAKRDAGDLFLTKVRDALGIDASSKIVLEFVEEDDFYFSKNVLVEELLEGLI